ncbi:MAG: hypothetical protein ABIK09_15785 [Pseudomonadota bacterium]
MKASMRHGMAFAALLLTGLLFGCGDGVVGAAYPDSTAPDGAAEDTLPAEDAATDTPDADVAPDVAFQANLFPNNPAKDEWETHTVTVANVGTEDGSLAGPYADVTNCLNEDGGWWREYDVPLFGLVKVQLCNLKKTVLPDADGSYLSVQVPADPLDPDDAFAELMLFHHMNVIHDFYKDTLGYDGMDFPLEGYVNVMAWLEMANPLPDIPQGWIGIDNAMFVPGESIEEIVEMAADLLQDFLGVEDDLADIPFKNDAIFFFQGEAVDFGWDADVIYHEYTHATVGGDRLFGIPVDEFGPDASPGAIHEAYGDYFACTILGDPQASEYALGALSGAARDLSVFKKCPEDYYGEVHDDGEIYGSALWEIRETIGREAADRILFDAMLTFGMETGFEGAAEATIAEAATLDPPKGDEVEAIFTAHGLLGCDDRIKPFIDTTQEVDATWLPGTQTTGVAEFAEAAPGYVQYTFEVEEGTTSIALSVTAEIGGLMGILGSFLGGGSVDLSAALKHDGPITYAFEGGYTHTETAVVHLEKIEGSLFSTTISGTCLEPGTHHLQFLSHTESEVMLLTMTMTQGSDPLPEETETNYTCE